MTAKSLVAIVAGLASWEAIIGLCSWAAKHGWPAYAAAAPDRAYDLTMLVARLTVAAIATLAAGALATRIAGAASRAALGVGGLLLLVSLGWHIHIWPQYPVWYHLVYLGYLLPLSLFGGRLACGKAG